MFHLKKMIGMLACAMVAGVMLFGSQGISAAAEKGVSIVIGGEAGSDDASKSAAGKRTRGNKVIIIAPTEEPVATSAPQATAVAGADDGSTSASISLDSSDEEVYVDDENSDSDYYIEESDSGNSGSSSNSGKSSAKKSSASKGAVKSADIPKTGVVRWEFLFAGIGLILVVMGTIISVKYIRYARNQAG